GMGPGRRASRPAVRRAYLRGGLCTLVCSGTAPGVYPGRQYPAQRAVTDRPRRQHVAGRGPDQPTADQRTGNLGWHRSGFLDQKPHLNAHYHSVRDSRKRKARVLSCCRQPCTCSSVSGSTPSSIPTAVIKGTRGAVLGVTGSRGGANKAALAASHNAT